MQSGVVVQMQPLIGSPQGGNIYLFPGMFLTSTILFNEDTGTFEITQ